MGRRPTTRSGRGRPASFGPAIPAETLRRAGEAPPPPPSRRRRYRDWLLDTDVEPSRYLLRALLIATLPTVALVAIFPGPATEEVVGRISPCLAIPALFSVVFVGLFSPFVEMAVMMWVLWGLDLLDRRGDRKLLAAAVGALLWTFVHLLQAGGSRWISTWSLFVFSLVFLGWRRRSLTTAVWMTCAVHVAHNLVVVLLTLMG